MTLFARWAHFIAHHSTAVIVSWAIAALGLFFIAGFGVGGKGSLEARTETGAPEVGGSDSYFVGNALDDATPEVMKTRIAAQFTGADPLDLNVQARLSASIANIAATDGVALVITPYGGFPGPAFTPANLEDSVDPSVLISATDDSFLIGVMFAPGGDGRPIVDLHSDIKSMFNDGLASLNDIAPDASLHVFSSDLFVTSFSHQLARDLVLGEAIAIPLALIVMVFVFGGFLAASTPIAGAFASIAGGLAVLYAFTFVFKVDDSAQNVVTVLGIGLCVDYGLFFVSRYREEMARARRSSAGTTETRIHALERAMETAGRTVFFSAITVAIAVGGMLFFKPDFLRAFGAAALGVVVTAMLVALSLVPAISFHFGEKLIGRGFLTRVPGVRRILSLTSDVERDEGAFSRLATWVQRRPWLVVAGCVVLLGTLAAPALGIHLRNSQAEMLPKTDADRIYLAEFNDRYPPLAEPGIDLIAEATLAEFSAWSSEIANLDGVERLAEPSMANGMVVSGVFITATDGGSPEAVAVVDAIRALDPPFRLYVGNQAANQRDFIDSIKDGAPLAFGLVIGATFLLLFLMTGSLLVPLKTLLINALSLSASIGVLTWIFQDHHLEGLLRFDSLGGIETYVVVLIVSFGFGLAMDYEVFLLARIKELVDKGVPNNEAVRLGLQRSGRIITSAAAIVVLVFLGFAAGDVLVIKEVGVGLAFAVFLDATVVRMLLVPATMTLLGQWNWWAPKALRGLYRRMSITH